MEQAVTVRAEGSQVSPAIVPPVSVPVMNVQLAGRFGNKPTALALIFKRPTVWGNVLRFVPQRGTAPTFHVITPSLGLDFRRSADRTHGDTATRVYIGQ